MTATMADTKRVDISLDIRKSAELSRFVDEARILLQEEIGLQYSSIAEKWELATPASYPPVVKLTIGDGISEVSVLMSPDLIADPWKLRNKMNVTWRQLLFVTVRTMQAKLNSSFNEHSEN